MALLVNNAKIKNTELTAPEIYVRLQYTAMPDGKKTTVLLLTGLNKELALTYQEIATNLPKGINLEMAEGQLQDLATIHELVKAHLEGLDLGLEVTIQL